MKPLSRFLLLTLVVSLQPQLFSQTIHWESMDGPYQPETRTHLRYPDGDRLFIGNNTGTYRTTDGGITWVHLSPPPGPNFSVYQSSTGALIGICDTATFSTDKSDPVMKKMFASTDRGEHWIARGGGRTHSYVYSFAGDTVYELLGMYGSKLGAPPGVPSVRRSTDGGNTWTCLVQAPYGGPGFIDVYARHGNVFVHVWPQDDQGVKRSTDGGLTWQTMIANKVMIHPPNSLLRKLRFYQWNVDWSTKEYIQLSTDDGVTWDTTLVADSGFVSLVTNGPGTLLVLR